MVQAYDERTGKIVAARARDIRIEKYADELKMIELEDGTTLRCTDTHLIMDAAGRFVEAGPHPGGPASQRRPRGCTGVLPEAGGEGPGL